MNAPAPVSRTVPTFSQTRSGPVLPARRRTVAYVDLPAQYEAERDLIHACVERVFADGGFVGSSFVDAFEEAVAAYCGAEQAIAVNSGTDALVMALSVAGIGPGDEVVTAPNSFIATAAAIAKVGARPVFADVLPDQNIDPAAVAGAITPRTRAIVPVHLTGRVCDMPALIAVAERHGLLVVEDAAQAIGSRLVGRGAGSFGKFGCFSTHPLKNLNAAGDGGFILTDDREAAARLRRLRSHGLVDRNTALEWGGVSRMDGLQAEILRMRLQRLDSLIEARRANMRRYRELLAPTPLFIPPDREAEFNSYHTLVVQLAGRDALQAYLGRCGIGTAVHYPVPLHLQPAAETLGYRPGDFPVAEAQAGCILSLPVHQFLTEDDIDYVAEAIATFYAA